MGIDSLPAKENPNEKVNGHRPGLPSPVASRLPAVALRPGAKWTIDGHGDELQNVKFVPVMPSPRMLLPSASADDQTREPRAATVQENSNEHVNSTEGPGSGKTRIRTGTHFGDPHYCNHHDHNGGIMTMRES
jgi:hypothetical protein